MKYRNKVKPNWVEEDLIACQSEQSYTESLIETIKQKDFIISRLFGKIMKIEHLCQEKGNFISKDDITAIIK